jgi:hypothetical protein
LIDFAFIDQSEFSETIFLGGILKKFVVKEAERDAFCLRPDSEVVAEGLVKHSWPKQNCEKTWIIFDRCRLFFGIYIYIYIYIYPTISQMTIPQRQLLRAPMWVFTSLFLVAGNII